MLSKIEADFKRLERRKEPISTKELERRWCEAREVMKKSGLDFLLIQQNNQYFSGYLRWFTDYPAVHGYPITLLFPIEGGMTMISHGAPPPAPPGPPDWALRGVEHRINAPYLPSLSYTTTYDAERVVEVLVSKGASAVGIVGMSFISATFYEYLKKKLPNVKFVEVTDFIDGLKAVKSEEELRLIKKSAEIQDIAVETALKAVKPGRREIEVTADIQRTLVSMGSEEQSIHCCSAPPGTPATHMHYHLQNRIIGEGDQVFIMIESSGLGGYWTEIGLTICLGHVPKELEAAWEAAKEAQKRVLNHVKPGIAPKELLDINNDVLVSKGYPPEGRLCGHGQGYDIVERPALLRDETLKLKPGMNLAIHPTAKSDKAYGWVCDNYIVTEAGGSDRLHRTPLEIVVLGE
jgi:Xaa-Pro aminopeptidase